MNFIKKHYEKIILGAVMLGLVLSVGFFVIKINQEREDMAQRYVTYLKKPVKQIEALKLEAWDSILRRCQTPI